MKTARGERRGGEGGGGREEGGEGGRGRAEVKVRLNECKIGNV